MSLPSNLDVVTDLRAENLSRVSVRSGNLQKPPAIDNSHEAPTSGRSVRACDPVNRRISDGDRDLLVFVLRQIFSGNRGEEITKAVDVDNLPCHGIFASHRRWPFETHEVFDLFPKAAGIDAVRYVRCSRRENISAVKCIARRVKLICLVRQLDGADRLVSFQNKTEDAVVRSDEIHMFALDQYRPARRSYTGVDYDDVNSSTRKIVD